MNKAKIIEVLNDVVRHIEWNIKHYEETPAPHYKGVLEGGLQGVRDHVANTIYAFGTCRANELRAIIEELESTKEGTND